jgi:glycosyltransferase involved in cell wall biosynthesis
MRVLYFHQYFNTPDGAGSTRSFEIARRLVERGHQVDMITSDREPPIDAPRWWQTSESGIRVHWTPLHYDNAMPFGRRMKVFLQFAWRAARYGRRFRPDVIFATSTPLTIAIPAIAAKKQTGAPMVFEVRDLWPEVPIQVGALNNPVMRRAALALERSAYRASSHIIALSPPIARHLEQKGYPESRISIIPNAADLDLFGANQDEQRSAVRASYPWLDHNPMVLFAGTLGIVNGVDYFVQIAAAVAEHDPRVRFVILGDGAERDVVRQLAMASGVLDKSLFMLGKVPKREIPRWLAGSDLATGFFTGHPFIGQQASPNKVFDALAAGRPVAMNFDGWLADLLRDHDCGILLPARDPAVAARMILQRLADPTWLASSGQRARALATTTFDRDRLVDKLEQVLLTVTGERRERTAGVARRTRASRSWS